MEHEQPQNQEPQNNLQQQSTPPQTPPSASSSKKRFSTQAVIIAILSILLLTTAGALAYVVTNNDNDGDTDNTVAVKDSKDEEEQKEETTNETSDSSSKVEPVNETASWDTLTNKAYSVSFQHPNGDDWVARITDNPLSTGQRATGSVKYTPCGPNCGWALLFRVISSGSSDDPGDSYAQNIFQDNDYYSLASKKSVNKSGATGTRWEYTPADSEAATIIYYYFTKGELAYAFEVNMNGSKTDAVDITKTGDLVMDTFQFTAN